LGQLWDSYPAQITQAFGCDAQVTHDASVDEKEFRSNFIRASRAGKNAARAEARARFVVYRPREHALRVELTNGLAVILPVKLIPDLRRAARRYVRTVEILGQGGGLHRESLDLDLSVPGLLSSVFAGPRWLAELGRVGGRKSSAPKQPLRAETGAKAIGWQPA
jgi:hypothetical protein